MTFRERLGAALPSGKFALGGSLAWGATMAVVAAFSFLLRGWSEPAAIARAVTLFLAGGAVAFAPAVVFARLFGRGRFEPTFAAALLGLAALSLGAAAAFNGLTYRVYYANWHAPFGTKLWLIEFLFTSASGVYQFLVLGVRLFVPLGLPALFVAALILARNARIKA